MKTKLALTAMLVAVGFLGLAEHFAIPWSTMNGGGGTSTSADGRMALSGTVGQSSAGGAASSDGRFHLSGGFWQAEVALCGCTLAISVSGGNIVLSWPCGTGGCLLEYADELRSPGSATIWQPVSPQPAGGVYSVPLTGTQRYFRLRSP